MADCQSDQKQLRIEESKLSGSISNKKIFQTHM